jgi:hypothetical protein
MNAESVRRLMVVAGVTASSGGMAVMVNAQMVGIPGEQVVPFALIAWVGVMLAVFGSESYR